VATDDVPELTYQVGKRLQRQHEFRDSQRPHKIRKAAPKKKRNSTTPETQEENREKEAPTHSHGW
jgi:hypothetical protein